MSCLRAYRVWFEGEEWQCLVVAETARQAKRIFARDEPTESGPGDTGIQALGLRNVTIPPSIIRPQLYIDCEPWNCAAWDYDEHCGSCELGAAKRLAWIEEEK